MPWDLFGIPLNEYIKKHGALPEIVSLNIIRRMAEGLTHIEQTIGIVHRDIKPGNIMVQPSDPKAYPDAQEDMHAILIDFGLAKDQDDLDGMTMAGASMGTPAFMAPEQISDAANVDIRADIYALGATLYNLLTGQAPFGKSEESTGTSSGRSALDILKERMEGKQPDPWKVVPNISDATRDVVMTAMAADAEERFYHTTLYCEQSIRRKNICSTIPAKCC